jgi:hypothetical protein
MNAPLPPPTNPTLRGLLDIKFLLETRQSRQTGAAGQAASFVDSALFMERGLQAASTWPIPLHPHLLAFAR